MDFRQNPKDGSCDLNFSDEEIKGLEKFLSLFISTRL